MPQFRYFLNIPEIIINFLVCFSQINIQKNNSKNNVKVSSNCNKIKIVVEKMIDWTTKSIHMQNVIRGNSILCSRVQLPKPSQSGDEPRVRRMGIIARSGMRLIINEIECQ